MTTTHVATPPASAMAAFVSATAAAGAGAGGGAGECGAQGGDGCMHRRYGRSSRAHDRGGALRSGGTDVDRRCDGIPAPSARAKLPTRLIVSNLAPMRRWLRGRNARMTPQFRHPQHGDRLCFHGRLRAHRRVFRSERQQSINRCSVLCGLPRLSNELRRRVA